MTFDKTVSAPSPGYPGLPGAGMPPAGAGGPGGGMASPATPAGPEGEGAPPDMGEIFMEWAFGQVAEAQQAGNEGAANAIAQGIKLIVQGQQALSGGAPQGPVDAPPDGGMGAPPPRPASRPLAPSTAPMGSAGGPTLRQGNF